MKPKSTFNVTYNHDNMDISEALIHNNMIEEGYTHPLNDLFFKISDYEEFAKMLHNRFNFRVFDFCSHNDYFKQLRCDEFCAQVAGNRKEVYAHFSCKSQELTEEIYKLYRQFSQDENDIRLFMSSFYMNGNNVDNSNKTFTIKDFKDSSKTYYPYIDTDSMFEQFLGNKENILILCGKPGTGKTKLSSQLLKYMIENAENIPYNKVEEFNSDYDFVNIAYVKSTEVLASDQWWREISSNQYDLVILDDLDYFLTSRNSEVQTQEDNDRNKFINQFLSFTDGIEKSRTKFIITTNQPFSDMDTALMRKGRLFDILELRDLSAEEALTIWKENGLTEDNFKYTGRVLQADLGSDIQKALNKKVKIIPYLLEQNISKIKAKNKKVGF